MRCHSVGTSRRCILCHGKQECSTKIVELNVFAQLRNVREYSGAADDRLALSYQVSVSLWNWLGRHIQAHINKCFL